MWVKRRVGIIRCSAEGRKRVEGVDVDGEMRRGWSGISFIKSGSFHRDDPTSG